MILAARAILPPPDIGEGSAWAWWYLYTDVAQASGAQTMITSWWRTLSENARVGGHPDSQHLIGAALDVTGTFYPARLRWATAVREADHWHVQLWRAGQAAALVRYLAR